MPAVVLVVAQRILFYVSVLVGVAALLIGVVLLITFVIAGIHTICEIHQKLPQKANPPAGSQDSVDGHQLRLREIRDEAAEQSVSSGYDAVLLGQASVWCPKGKKRKRRPLSWYAVIPVTENRGKQRLYI